MSQPHPNRRAVLLMLLLLQLGLVGLGFAGWRQFDSLAILRSPVGEGSTAERDFFGGTDWIRWEDGEQGITAVSVHPLVEDNPLLKGNYVLPGDVLRKIDYLPVYNSQSVRDQVRRSAPGTIFIYTLERPSPAGFQPEQVSLFIECGAEPMFAFTQRRWLWSMTPWMIVPGAFLALSSLLIIFPLVRRDFRENWSVFLLLLSALGVFTLQILHHIGLLVSTQYGSSVTEARFALALAGCTSLYSWLFLVRSTPGKMRWFALLPGITVLCAMIPLAGALASDSFWVYREWFVAAAWTAFHALTLGALLLGIASHWRERSRMDKVFHVLSIPYVGAMLWVHSSPLLGMGDGPGEWGQLGSMIACFIPLISAVASQLKFGRVSLVLTQTLEYLLFAASGLVLYFIIHPSLDYLGVQFKYRNILEVSLLMLGLLVLRLLFHTYENRLRRYFISSRQKKALAMREFHSTIPSYTSSSALSEAVVRELRNYFRSPSVSLWMKGSESPIAGLNEERLAGLYGQLQQAGSFWSRNEQLGGAPLDRAMEEELSASGLFLAFPIPIREEEFGLLLLGRKGRQVYNLDDIALIQNTLQPTRLTLGVLHLIEREKLLLEKNYEANLTALRSQINPHFLFNTLNTISSLIHDSPNDAEAATEKLAFIFRYTLKHSSRSLVTFSEEMSLVRTYLEIEQLRFGARLSVEIAVAPELEKVEIPAFAIQTFVENCIKHGIAKMIGKGVVRIAVSESNGFAVCVVEDNGPGIDLSRIHSSTGLNNVITRLEQIYQQKNLLTFENTGSGTRVTLKIPLHNHGIHA